MFAAGYAAAQNLAEQPRVDGFVLSADDDAFLDEIERANFLFFWEQSIPDTGLVKDRCNTRTERDAGTVGSIAATGFGLTALCIGSERKYAPPAEARDRAMAALRFLAARMPTHRGFFYHWADVVTVNACGIRRSPR